MASLSLLAKYSCLFSKHSTVTTTHKHISKSVDDVVMMLSCGDDVRMMWCVTQSEEGLLQVSLHLLPDALLHVVRTVAPVAIKH